MVPPSHPLPGGAPAVAFASALVLAAAAAAPHEARAEPPVAAYAFPAGGQRGTEVSVRVGGLFFHGEAGFAISGPGVAADPVIREVPRIWFEGPMIHQPASQRGEDYPRDHAASIRLAADAPLGPRRWHCATAQGVTASLPFLVGDLPEIVERELDGDPVPVPVALPVTVNGRLFPRQDRDQWDFDAAAGEWITGEIAGRRLGYPIEPTLTLAGPDGRPVEALVSEVGGDPRFSFRAPRAGTYRVEVADGNFGGGQAFIYRLTLRRGPAATGIFPLGGRRGTSLTAELSGPALPAPVSLPVTLSSDPAASWQPVATTDGAVFLLQVGGDPEAVEAAGRPSPLPLPGVANGRIAAPGEADEWTLALKKDQTVRLEVFAARLGSRLDARLSVGDDTGAELAANDDAGPDSSDSLLAFTARRDGLHRVRISDRFASRGGPDFAYRLVARPQEAVDFRLGATGDAVTIVRDAPAPEPALPADPKAPAPRKPRVRGSGLTVNLEAFGALKGEVVLEAEGLPAGVTLDEASRKVSAARKTTELYFDAAPGTPLQAGEFRLRGTVQVDGKPVTREVALPFRPGGPGTGGLRFAVAPAVPFSFAGDYWVETGYPVGSRLTKTYRLDRGGFTGPLRVELSDRQIRHLQGVTAEPVTLPAGADRFSYTVTLPPRMEMGRTCRVQLMISGEIAEPDGRRHRVSYTNASPEQQMMSIVSEGRLHLAAGATSVRVEAGKAVRLPVTLRRDPRLAAVPVRLSLEVPAPTAGVAAAPVDLPPGRDGAEIEIRFGDRPGPFLQPVKVRAVSLSQDPAALHEAELEIELVSIQPG